MTQHNHPIQQSYHTTCSAKCICSTYARRDDPGWQFSLTPAVRTASFLARLLTASRSITPPDIRRYQSVRPVDPDPGPDRGMMPANRRPVAFMSQSLTPTQQRYSADELATLAMVLALPKWQSWIEGRAITAVPSLHRPCGGCRRRGESGAEGRRRGRRDGGGGGGGGGRGERPT